MSATAGRSGGVAFLLDPQGHILGDLFAYNRGESITVDTDQSQIDKMLATFDHYIIMDDVEVTNLSEQLTALGIGGPNAREVLAAAGLSISEMKALQTEPVRWQNIECTVVRGEDEQNVAYEVWLPPDQVRQLWDALLAAGATAVGSEALEMHRVMSGVPRYGVDIRERDLRQEPNKREP